MPTTIKRTTLIVPDAGAMMRFYRDVLGWRVDYDAQFKLSGGIIPCAKPGDDVQLYMMGGPDRDIGKVGLLEWTNPRLPDPGPPKRRLGIGDVVLVADVPDMKALVEKISNFPGAAIHSPPADGTFPDPRGAGTIEYSSMAFFDPSGTFYETYYRYNRPNPEKFLIRRTTCIVRDVDRSLAFLTGVLGLAKYQDSTMQIEGMLAAGKKGDTVRFAVCRAQHDYIGMVGALAFLKDPLPDPGEKSFDYGVGRALFVAHNDDVRGLAAKIAAAGGRITRGPFERTVPKSGGAGETKMISLGFHDPDGMLWEVNQLS
ncbi:MAG: VOC family protein [Alphaproteobacteria bacterium]|nr:VOC family protein [Alphaproteobacteria bacterium]